MELSIGTKSSGLLFPLKPQKIYALRILVLVCN